MTQISIPSRRTVKAVPSWVYLGAIFVLVLIVIAVGYLTWSRLGASSAGSSSFKTVPARFGPFETRVMVKGELQAVDNIDINCDVEGSNTIIQLVPEGSAVKKGDVLIKLDSSQISQKLEDATIELQRATAEVTAANEMLEIQKSQNAANLEAAEVSLQLAQIDYKKYVEGEYPSLQADARMAVEKASTAVKTKSDDLTQTRSLFSKGFVTATEVKNKELDLAAAQRDLVKANTDQSVLEKYTHEANLASKKSALAQAEQKLERTKRENAANLSQKDSDFQSKKQQLDLIQRRVIHYKEQLTNCTILAPADGMVVYQNNNNQGRDSASVAEGATVREHQTLMRLPDARHMKVVLKINESQINGIKLGLTSSITLNGDNTQLKGTITKISPVPDSTDRWMNPDRKDYPVDMILENTPPGLRPGMSVVVNILVDRKDDVVSVPIASLYSVGQDRYVFTPNGDEATPIKLKQVGRSNEQDIHVIDGLEAGTNVILLEPGQGKILLEKAGIKVADVQPAASGPGGVDGAGMGKRNRDGTGAGGNGSGGGGRRNREGNPSGEATPGSAAPTQQPATNQPAPAAESK